MAEVSVLLEESVAGEEEYGPSFLKALVEWIDAEEGLDPDAGMPE